jgi:hypothetical protein
MTIGKILLSLLVAFFSLSLSVHADLYAVPPDAPNWCKNAKRYLTPTGSRQPIDCQKPNKVPLCIKLNNYGCLWQPTRAGWEGTDIVKGNNGAHDNRGMRANEPINNGHSVFVHPKWSISAKFRWFYARAKNRSFLKLAERYLPWCDTQGSSKVKNGWHNSCGLEASQFVKGKNYCRKPKSGNPSRAQCNSCNCPNEVSAKWTKGTGLSIHDPAVLFDRNGIPNDLMMNLTLSNSTNELGGYQPNPKIMKEGGAIFSQWLKQQKQ